MRIPDAGVAVSDDNADVRVNDGNTVKDTGLYELYKNVVERFNNSMINLANSYANNASPNNATGQWISRTGDVQSSAVAYSYGGRQTIQDFNSTVANCQAPATALISDNYKGNLSPKSDNPGSNGCMVAGGSLKYAGLYKNINKVKEYDAWNPNTGLPVKFAPTNWAGVDCIGLVLHGMSYANNPANTVDGASIQLTGSGDVKIPGVSVTVPSLAYTSAAMIFNNGKSYDTLYYWSANDISKQLIHKGDLLRYTDKKTGSTVHITTVFDEKKRDGVNYDIIHASGDNKLCYGQVDDTLPDTCSFNRKVIKNEIKDKLKSPTLKNPTGFGRIKLRD